MKALKAVNKLLLSCTAAVEGALQPFPHCTNAMVGSDPRLNPGGNETRVSGVFWCVVLTTEPICNILCSNNPLLYALSKTDPLLSAANMD